MRELTGLLAHCVAEPSSNFKMCEYISLSMLPLLFCHIHHPLPELLKVFIVSKTDFSEFLIITNRNNGQKKVRRIFKKLISKYLSSNVQLDVLFRLLDVGVRKQERRGAPTSALLPWAVPTSSKRHDTDMHTNTFRPDL